MSGRNCFKVGCRKIKSTNGSKHGVLYIEEEYSLHIYDGNKKYKWIILIKRFEKYKVVVLSFYFTKFAKSKGIKKFKRNVGRDCLSPITTLRLFKECFNLCTQQYGDYSFCFYALDDNYIDHSQREDLNRRMSIFYAFLKRDCIKNSYDMMQKGNIMHNIYVGYNKDLHNEDTIDEFIKFYEPIITEEVNTLYSEQDSQKL
ncbi:hypothetical protein [Riemerella columbina]|uniref:hypothetical protein n=1 Tax=Riemerella columbina TaxID=103810 RepID=UPI00037036A3|nr:hypothetical protein [Riemerella columbina]